MYLRYLNRLFSFLGFFLEEFGALVSGFCFCFCLKKKILNLNFFFLLPNVCIHIQSNETISSHTTTGVETLFTNFNVFVCK